jgi:hypothetical protein
MVLIAIRLIPPVKMTLEKALADIDGDACGSHAEADQAAQGVARLQRAQARFSRQGKRVSDAENRLVTVLFCCNHRFLSGRRTPPGIGGSKFKMRGLSSGAARRLHNETKSAEGLGQIRALECQLALGS